MAESPNAHYWFTLLFFVITALACYFNKEFAQVVFKFLEKFDKPLLYILAYNIIMRIIDLKLK